MQVEVDVKYMQTNFGGPGFSSFGDFVPFQIWPTMHLPSENHYRVGVKYFFVLNYIVIYQLLF